MSQASASEKPAPAAGPLTAAITGEGIRRRSTIAVCSASAPRRTCAGRSIESSSTPVLNQLTSPPAQKALPEPVMIRARSGAWSASQAKMTVISPIISGLIALKASGRSRVRVPISPSISSRSVFISGGFMVSLVICSLPCRLSSAYRTKVDTRLGWPAGQEPTLWPVSSDPDSPETTRAERIAQQRRELPDSPGVYLFHGADEQILYVGKARSIRKRVASHFSGGETRLTSLLELIECLLTTPDAA